jgi:DNA-binding transcriptional LysR family regulator
MVVAEGSMAKAAHRLGITQPAVSRVIADLEHTLSARLLDRGPRGVETTMFGRALIRRGSAAFDELKQAVADIETLGDPTSGELRIGCPEGIASSVLGPILREFLRRHPRVIADVNALAPSMISGLQERKHDLVLTRFMLDQHRLVPGEHPLATDFNVELLFDDPLVVMTNAQSPWTRRRKVELAELVDEPWILTEPGSWNFTRVTEAFKTQGLDMPKIVLMAGSLDLRAQFLIDGAYMAPFAVSNARMIAARYAVKALPLELNVRAPSVVLITVKHRTLNPTVARFIEHLRKSTRTMGAAPRRAVQR